MKQFQIEYNGKQEIVEIDDHPSVGVIMPILQRCMKTKVGQREPEIDSFEWFIGICTNFITKAPWQLKNVDVLRNLDFKTTYSQLANIIGDEYPVIDFLSPGLKLLYGKRLESVASTSQTESTMNSSSLDSPPSK